MKFAAIADVHGNCLALEAVLADISSLGITEVVNLGDHLSGPLEARRAADLLMARDFPSVQGDQDRRLVELGPAGASRRADHKQLQQTHLNWLASLPPTRLYREDVFLCHASPVSNASYWLDHVTEDGNIQATPLHEIEIGAAEIDASLILCGHTHIPRVVRLRDGRLVVNAGSVGCPGYEGAKPVPHRVQTERPTPATPSSSVRRGDGASRSVMCLMTTWRWLNWREPTECRPGPTHSPAAGSNRARRHACGIGAIEALSGLPGDTDDESAKSAPTAAPQKQSLFGCFRIRLCLIRIRKRNR